MLLHPCGLRQHAVKLQSTYNLELSQKENPVKATQIQHNMAAFNLVNHLVTEKTEDIQKVPKLMWHILDLEHFQLIDEALLKRLAE